MKSKSFEIKESPALKGKQNKTFDFVGLYKTAAETNVKLLENRKSGENTNKENSFVTKSDVGTPKRARSPNKKKKKNKNEPVDISVVNIDGREFNESAAQISPVEDTRQTSTPYSSSKSHNRASNVKSIMKNSSVVDEIAMDESDYSTPSRNPKKRNKSVSFMLDDTEEVAIKKTKSEESIKVEKKSEKLKAKHKDRVNKKLKKNKKNISEEKENNVNNIDTEQIVEEKKTKSKVVKTKSILENVDSPVSDSQVTNSEKKKKLKKIKKRKKVEDSSEPTENESNNNEDPTDVPKAKKLKKKKHLVKSVQSIDTTETEGEPATKAHKKDVKPDVIAEDLENLSIGDNAHTLTYLLDEMAVVDKNKRKKNKVKRKKDKPQTASVSSSETADLEKIEEGKEKVIWKKRKWNKDKKGGIGEDTLVTSVIVENLPLSIMMTYKKVLADHFGQFGLIKKIGVAEVYPTEEPKPLFTTTINFYSDGAATKALEEDNTMLEGSRIRVKRPLPPTQTTLVVRSYGELSEQSLSSVFTGAGRVRSMRQLLKGRKAMATAFIEFDGPAAVERAIKMAEDAKIGGKKIHVSKFELRAARTAKKPEASPDSENEGDSEDSNE